MYSKFQPSGELGGWLFWRATAPNIQWPQKLLTEKSCSKSFKAYKQSSWGEQEHRSVRAGIFAISWDSGTPCNHFNQSLFCPLISIHADNNNVLVIFRPCRADENIHSTTNFRTSRMTLAWITAVKLAYKCFSECSMNAGVWQYYSVVTTRLLIPAGILAHGNVLAHKEMCHCACNKLA